MMGKTFSNYIDKKSSGAFNIVLDSRPETNGEYSLFRNLTSCYDLRDIVVIGARDDFYYIETSPNSKFLLIDPDKEAIDNLKNYTKNKNFSKVYFWNQGLWSSDGFEVEIYDGGTAFPISNHSEYANNIKSGIIVDPYYNHKNINDSSLSLGRFPCTTLEIVTSKLNFNSIDFLKIDIEGAEYEVLKYFSRLNKIKFIQYEYNTMWKNAGVSHQDFWGLLEDKFHYIITPDGLKKLNQPIQQYFYANILASDIDFGENILFI